MKRIVSKPLFLINIFLLLSLLFIICIFLRGRKGILADPALYSTMAENGVFQIYTAKDLMWFCWYVNHAYTDLDAVLMNNLDLSSDRRDSVTAYSGTFDGNGYAIKNYSNHKELFNTIEIDGVIKDLTMDNVSIVSGKYGCGGIAYKNYGLIENCTVSGYVEGVDYTGGIASRNYGIITGCTNKARVVSTQAGEFQYNNMNGGGYGAGGIAGISGTSVDKHEKMPPAVAIADCINEGSITAETQAGGICAFLTDRTRDFQKENGIEEEEYYSIYNCKNYGDVCVNQITDSQGSDTKAAGICCDIYWGNLYHCANLGNVSISGDGEQDINNPLGYSNRPNAIAYTYGLSPESSYFEDCVSLKGLIPETMRHENIMEITEDELEAWEEGKLPYISNSWRFDLADGVKACSLEALGVEQSPKSQSRGNVFLSGSFSLTLPEGFQITEETVNGTVYGLRISWNGKDKKGFEEKYGSVDYEAWLLKKQADMAAAINRFTELLEEDDVEDHDFMEVLHYTIPNIQLLYIDRVVRSGSYHIINNNIFINYECKYRKNRLREENHYLKNIVSILLEGNKIDGYEAEWIMLFTNRRNNICPSENYIWEIQNGFYPLTGNEKSIEAKYGQSLYSIAGEHLGEGNAWEELACINGIENPDMIYEGQSIMVPDLENRKKNKYGPPDAAYLLNQAKGKP